MVHMQLVTLDKKYMELEEQWRNFEKHIEASFEETELKSYAKAQSPLENEIRFTVCGMTCYIEFAHDIKEGVVRYGITKQATVIGDEKRAFKAVTFDRLGNLNRQIVMDRRNEVLQFHENMLLHLVQAMNSEYFESATSQGE